MSQPKLEEGVFGVANAVREGRVIADIMAHRAAAILGRKLSHVGPYVYTLVLAEHPHWQPVDSVWCGNEIVWKTGAQAIADYCLEEYDAWLAEVRASNEEE